MLKTLMLPLLALFSLSGATAALADTDATPAQIYQAVQSGQLPQATQMIQQVLRDHPRNAKAHFIAAEVAARSGDFAVARQQLAMAQQLDPAQSFASPRAVGELQAQLSGTGAGVPYAAQGLAPAPHRSTVPWGLIIILGAGALAVWGFMRNRSQRLYGQPYGAMQPGAGMGVPGTPGYGAGYGPGYGPMGGGSGLMGSLAGGLAIGAGVAAGEELVHHVLDGNSQSGYVPQQEAQVNEPPVNSDAGGNDFGTSDPNSWGGDAGGGDASWGGGGDSGGGWGGDSGGGGDWT